MKRFAFLLSFLLFATVSAGAQTVTATAQWNQVEGPTTAGQFAYTIKVDAGAVQTLTTSCVLVNSLTTCSGPVAGWNPSITHTVVLTATFNGNSASSTFVTTPGPTAPTGGKVIVVIIGGDNDDDE